MIVGIGIDLVEVKRFEKAAVKAAFLCRVFTEGEIGLFEERGKDLKVLAGCFAGKEAVAKALGTGFSGFWPGDVEVLRDSSGRPSVALSGRALEIAEALGVVRWHISLTNTAEYAAAYVVAEKEG